MKSKTNNNITSPESIPTKVRKPYKYADDYFCMFAFSKKPVSEAFIEDLSHKMITWANFDGGDGKKEAFRINDFYDELGIPSRDFYRWVDKYPQLKDAHAYAKRRIASRREHGAATKRYVDATIARTIGYYCEASVAEQERLAKLKLDNNGEAQGNIQVVMMPAPKTGRVKPKAKKENNE